MKILHLIQAGRRRRHFPAFTLVEMMIATGIFLFIFVGVVVGIQIFALRVYTLGATKLTATQGSRKLMDQIRDEIRQAKLLQVGNCDNSGNNFFGAITGSNAAIGNAIQIYSTTNTASAGVGAAYSIYFLQTNNFASGTSNSLIWYSVTATTSNSIDMADYITNLDVFSAVELVQMSPGVYDYQTISNDTKNNQAYAIKLQFSQWEYPIAVISTNGGYNAYDYYQLRTVVCRRALD